LFVKSQTHLQSLKIVIVQRTLHLDLANPKCGPHLRFFFHRSRPHVFFPSRHFDVRCACQSPSRPGRCQLPPSLGFRVSRRPAQAAFVVRRRRPSRQFGSVHLRSRAVAAYAQLEGGRARQGGRTGVEKSRGGDGGTESDVEGRNCRCKVVGRFAYMQSLDLYLQS